MTFFSKLGTNMILPKDVLIQSKETDAVVGSLNATIGIATINKQPMELSSIHNITKNLASSKFLPYSPTPGIISLRQRWQEKIIAQNSNIDAKYLTLPTVTAGITQGIDIAANLFSEKGDALLLPNLFWQNYSQIYKVKLENNIYKYEQFTDDNKFNLDSFKTTLESIQENKISLILNFPNNPTGYTPNIDELNGIVNILDTFAKQNKDKNIIVITDDAYFGLFFEKGYANSTLNHIYKLADNPNCLVVKLDGITKEYYSWGLRIGFITYYTKDENLHNVLLEKTQGFLRSTTSSPSNISQQIALELLSDKDVPEQKNNNDLIIENRYKELKKQIKNNELEKLVTVLPFNSGYFFTIKLPKNINAHDFRIKLLNDYKIGVYSMDDEHIRIAFSCVDEHYIKELIFNLTQCLNDFSLS